MHSNNLVTQYRSFQIILAPRLFRNNGDKENVHDAYAIISNINNANRDEKESGTHYVVEDVDSDYSDEDSFEKYDTSLNS